MAVFSLEKDMASQESVVNGCTDSYSVQLAKCFLCVYVSATNEAVQSYNFFSGLTSFTHHSVILHVLMKKLRFSILFGEKL